MNERARKLTSAERHFLDGVCEGRPRSAPPEAPHRLFERHAAAAGERVAVRYRDGTLTYAELNRRANRLARYLVERGAGAESRVVVSVDPGFDIVIALLSILKAGATYVPLDPAHPDAHLGTILEDTHPALAITTRELPGALAAGVERVGLDESEALLSSRSECDLAVPEDREATAYVYYTSGTTGKPKGVMASYGNLASYIAAARERYGFTSAEVVPAIARFGFSISLFELLTVLTAGGTLVVLDRDHVRDPARLAWTLRGVTLFHAGPSLLRPLLDHIRTHYDDFSAFAGVRHASSGGDMIPPEVLESAKAVFQNAELYVIYGCSEIACMGCTYEVRRDVPLTRTYVGRPFDAMAVRIADEALGRVAVGEVGEICFAGDGVVKGYLNRPDLTASKFVEIDGRRFYRTGDLGRVTEEGFVEILGRADFQAKIRGMRVELAEVEHHLRRAPNVKDGVVMPRNGEGGEKVLVAYVVLEPRDAPVRGNGPSYAAVIRRHMVEHLPDYMVPAIYLELPSLPLNHNLKVDRRALPEPTLAAARGGRTRQPETPTERRLATIWERMLGVDDVRLDDNFFELGGHSLLAVGLLVDVKRELGVELDAMDVLRESLEVLARLCDERSGRARAETFRAARRVPADCLDLFHFGDGNTLYGVFDRPRDGARREHAVLVCAPFGQEKTRAHFVLQSLARRLARLGVPSLAFDYFGSGDSIGEGVFGSPERWQRDVVDAFEELVRRTGAGRVTAVGVRFGATLLSAVAPSLGLARLVFWDPVWSGREHVSNLARMHAEYMAGAEHPPARTPAESVPIVELVGSEYSTEALAQMQRLSIAALPLTVPVKWLATSPSRNQAAAFERIRKGAEGSRLQRLDVDCAWHETSRLEDTLPDVGITAALASMCTEDT